jgi:UDP-galactopyranose mutase
MKLLSRGIPVKQWGRDPKELPASIINRLPVNFNYDCWYFDDPWQGIPLHGYTEIFKRLLANPKIEVLLNTDYFEMRNSLPNNALTIYSGPIDQFFNYQHGVLGWRTLSFEREVHKVEDFQGTSVINYTEEKVPYTRIHEFKHYHPERSTDFKSAQTVTFKEYSHLAGKNENPYYPINTAEDREKYNLYCQEVEKCKNVIFGGRLGGYKYLNMDQVIGMALETYEKIKAKPWKN